MLEQYEAAQAWLENYPQLNTLLSALALLVAAWLSNWIVKRILLRGIYRALRASSIGTDTAVLDAKIIARLANIVPALVIIWSGNLKEEVVWYRERIDHGWNAISLGLIFFHFVLPFLLLLSRDLKRKGRPLLWIALLLLVMRYVDLYWQAGPAFHPEGLSFHWLDLATLAGVGGLWLAAFARRLARRPLLPVNDPFLEEALGHE